MSTKAFDIVISGASFAGLALARSLRLALGKDLTIALIDRAAGPPSGDDTRAFAIWDGAVAGYIVPSFDLHRALFAALDGDANVTWIAPAEAKGLAADAAGITTQLADGQTLRSALIVAAEGRRSRLRDAAGIKTTGWGYGQRGIVAIVQFTEDHHGTAIQHFLPGGPFAILPMTGNRACITWSSAEDEAAQVLALDEAEGI